VRWRCALRRHDWASVRAWVPREDLVRKRRRRLWRRLDRCTRCGKERVTDVFGSRRVE
jgi:hypothetical protein